MSWGTLQDPAFCGRLCVTLLHSLWLVTLLAALARMVDRLVGRRAVERSYAIHVAALLASILALPATYWIVAAQRVTPIAEVAAAVEAGPAAASASPVAAPPATTPPGRGHSVAAPPGAIASVTAPRDAVAEAALPASPPGPGPWTTIAPWLAAAYATGVAAMLLRLALGMWRAQRLGAGAEILRDGPLVDLLHSLADRWSMRVEPTLARAERIVTPKVIGLLRPTILLPASAISGLSTDELALILAHELAHVRRHDMWINLLQRLAETVLFFNPALWYLSRRVSLLREYCCDEAVCSSRADAGYEPHVRYAQALLRVVEIAGTGRDHAELVSLGAGGHSPSQLRRRVARLFGEPIAESVRFSRSGVILIGMLASLLLVSLLLGRSVDAENATSRKPDKGPDRKTATAQGREGESGTVTISGRIVLEDGSPATQPGWLYYQSRITPNGSVAGTDAQYRDRFKTKVPAGSLVLSYSADGYAPAWVGPMSTHAGETLDNITIVLKPGYSVALRVVNERNEPIVGAEFSALPQIEGGLGGSVVEKVVDSHGEYLLQHLADAPYSFTVSAAGHELLRTPPLQLKADSPLVLRMRRSKPTTGVVLNADGTAAEGAELRLRYEATSPEEQHFLAPSSSGKVMATTDGEGRFLLDRLVGGSSHFFVVETADGARTILRDVRAGQEALRVTVPPRRGLKVQIVGDLDKLPKRQNRPFIEVCQRLLLQASNSNHSFSDLIGGEAFVTPNHEGGTADYQGLVEGTVEVTAGEQTKTVQVVDAGVTEVEFQIGGKPAAATPTESAKESASTHRFTLHVVDPAGKPVPAARVEILTSPLPTAEQILQGEFVEKGSYGARAKADQDGRLVVSFPRQPGWLNYCIMTPGYGPYWAAWSADDLRKKIPHDFTAELESGWSIGSRVVDEQGKPIEGAKVRLFVNFKKPPGDTSELGVGAQPETNVQGVWSYDCVPESKDYVFCEISQPDFVPLRQRLTRSEFALDGAGAPNGEVVLRRGLAVTGKVTDKEGKPIEGALVRANFVNDLREAKTDEAGVYRLVGCEPRLAKIVVSAEGMAVDMKELRISPEMEPVDFQMQPGGHVRIRVLDENDQPVAKARIFFQHWRGWWERFEFDHVVCRRERRLGME